MTSVYIIYQFNYITQHVIQDKVFWVVILCSVVVGYHLHTPRPHALLTVASLQGHPLHCSC